MAMRGVSSISTALRRERFQGARSNVSRLRHDDIEAPITRATHKLGEAD
jgi:hypothetical protein